MNQALIQVMDRFFKQGTEGEFFPTD